MKKNTEYLNKTEMNDVEIIEQHGAWFVSYANENGAHVKILKSDGRAKGFRSLDPIVNVLRFIHGVERFSVVAQLVPLKASRRYRKNA